MGRGEVRRHRTVRHVESKSRRGGSNTGTRYRATTARTILRAGGGSRLLCFHVSTTACPTRAAVVRTLVAATPGPASVVMQSSRSARRPSPTDQTVLMEAFGIIGRASPPRWRASPASSTMWNETKPARWRVLSGGASPTSSMSRDRDRPGIEAIGPSFILAAAELPVCHPVILDRLPGDSDLLHDQLQYHSPPVVWVFVWRSQQVVQ